VNRGSLVLALVLAAAPAHADEAGDRAVQLFKRGRELMGQGKIAEACQAFENSLVLDAVLGTKLNLGECMAKLGRNADAYRMFEAAEKDATSQNSPGRAKYAREQLTALKSKVAFVRLTIDEPSLTGLTLELGPVGSPRPLPRDVWGEPHVVDPGAIVVVARAPEHVDLEVKQSIAAGAEATLRIAKLERVTTDKTTRDPSVRTTHAYKKSRTPLLLSAGGLGLLVGSAVVGFVAKSRYEKAVDARDSDGVDSAGQLADVGTVIGVVGGVTILGGLVWYFVSDAKPVRVSPAATPSGTALLTFSGSF
jgi:hypothetical protein